MGDDGEGVKPYVYVLKELDGKDYCYEVSFRNPDLSEFKLGTLTVRTGPDAFIEFIALEGVAIPANIDVVITPVDSELQPITSASDSQGNNKPIKFKLIEANMNRADSISQLKDPRISAAYIELFTMDQESSQSSILFDQNQTSTSTAYYNFKKQHLSPVIHGTIKHLLPKIES
jgi:hypothetical protein